MNTPNKTVGVGIIGCGNISDAYFNGANTFEILNIIACADINISAAEKKAEAHGCVAQSVDELLANPEIDLVINLTIPAVHAEISIAALNAGKHVHCEKPLAVSLEDGKAVLDLAAERGLLVGCAPDTFLGAGLQTSRKLIDDQWIGKVIGGTAFMMGRGPESWHPNPAFFYQIGAGPLFDMGPYYITALVHLLGPIKSVRAATSKAFEVRTATSIEAFGQELQVNVPTHYVGILEFHSGPTLTMTISFDVHKHGHSPIEIYGTQGSLKVPDPNTFDGPVELWTPTTKEWRSQALSHPYATNMRSIGAADIAYSILSNGQRTPRSSGALAYHALEVMHAFEKASSSEQTIVIESKPQQPTALPLGLISGRLDP
ncbi:Gfo/Idh/MocA family oxidoreductase [Coraliomargarita sp. SDUM461004]|uniref:Gfo/Idh/MocA family oxidoreductase n=1 Tax=Thalassobacterium sedimentorum TaxID=3041258 RepID=A0ABU1AFZ0_9BACT|nr:Gfo/Idh/MocA family oxidoreductase [Coraliomargarita sp. SDUM461004]MDQ8193749.1 Gfo/Idh/MocA family oxidoreductase [Coraliomargarita sp. SDUM461004]